MNHMEQVAKMLGVELEEEFMIAVDGEKSDRKYKLTDTGCCACNSNGEWYNTKAINHILSGIYEIVKTPKPILDNAEKEYLSNIIKPFRNCVTSVTKRRYFNSNEIEYISVTYIDRLMDNSTYIFSLPNFKARTMYKGMKAGKHYTLEELGL